MLDGAPRRRAESSVNWPLPTNWSPAEVFAGHYNTAINGGSGYNAYYDLAA